MIRAATDWAPWGFWVGTQISHRSDSTEAVQFMGSMVAWARYGTS